MSQQLQRKDLLPQLRNIDPYAFQELVAELWELQEYETELLRDQSVHILAKRDDTVLDQGVAVQTRRLSEGYKVDSTDIAQFIDARRHDGVESVVIVTTTGFTDDAIDRANREGMKLVNGEELAQLIRDLEAADLLEKYREQDSSSSSLSATDIPAKDMFIQVVAATGAWIFSFLLVAVFPIFYADQAGTFMLVGFFGGLLAWFAIPVTLYRDTSEINAQEIEYQPSPVLWSILGLLGAGLTSTYYLYTRLKRA